MPTLESCIFCKIISQEIPATVRYEDSEMLAFDDINPNAPIHVLVIPKQHIDSLAATQADHQELLGRLLYRCKLLAEELNISDSGYRVVINTGRWGGQVVPHLHLHILGGAPLPAKIGLLTEVELPEAQTTIIHKSKV